MSRDTSIEPGLEVVTSDDHSLGRVTEILGDGQYFRVDCAFGLDYYVPARAVRSVSSGRVLLRVSDARARNSGWEARPQS